MTVRPKSKPLRDPEYLRAVRLMRCLVTGQRATESLSIDPAHIGTAGKGMKSPDNEVIPLRHDIHVACHQRGEIPVLRDVLPDDVLRAALRALAREMYREWKDG